MSITIFVKNQSVFYSRMPLGAPISAGGFEQSFAAGAGLYYSAARPIKRAKVAAAL
ncbi:hypothetical protein [Sinorhizobium saheli]|jgi:hypothetical protein|uniref:hypothetical protein n=1 Tax=Sinorhizobium saheli TaxID=36856 RepID=UPI0012976ABA|nr:hypothetical protein [Sinorhizobium saheli]MQW88356.1 hypothetical protein [Sinorhizobium saheli]